MKKENTKEVLNTDIALKLIEIDKINELAIKIADFHKSDFKGLNKEKVVTILKLFGILSITKHYQWNELQFLSVLNRLENKINFAATFNDGLLQIIAAHENASILKEMFTQTCELQEEKENGEIIKIATLNIAI